MKQDKNQLSKLSKRSQDLYNEIVESTIDLDKDILNGFELFNRKVTDIPKLWNPFLQKVGLAGFVGTSDAGKSTFLRQLSLAIALKKDEFLGYPLSATSNKVLYISTEDEANSVSYSIQKQIEKMDVKDEDISLLENINFIFGSESIAQKTSKALKNYQFDLIVIDSFADIFTLDLNANTQVREFLNIFDIIAKKNNCLIIFLHHIGKSSYFKGPNKNSIIGSQAFEAKMRVVLELRPKYKDPNQIDLWVLKCNYLPSENKIRGYKLLFKDLYFTNTNERTGAHIPKNNKKALKKKTTKKDNPKIIEKVIELKNNKLSLRAIETKLKGTEFAVSKSVINQICNSHKKLITP